MTAFTRLFSSLYKKPSHLATFALLISLSSQASADNIYHVELIVFERSERPATGDEERWGNNFHLAYPTPWLRLVDPKEEISSQEEAEPDDFLQALQAERQSINGEADLADQQASAPIQQHYRYLPADQQNLSKTKESLNGSRQLRVLFHEAWTQPFPAPEKAPALILHGGNRYGDHFELQGFIRLGVSKFLQLETDLWFTQFVPNYGQEADPWPELPIEPNETIHAASIGPSLTQTIESPTPEEEVNQDNSWDADGYEAAAQPEYLVKQIITLRQKRRMRSGELHYLDHPRLGVVIKISPLQQKPQI